jgi:hypothetical protein
MAQDAGAQKTAVQQDSCRGRLHCCHVRVRGGWGGGGGAATYNAILDGDGNVHSDVPSDDERTAVINGFASEVCASYVPMRVTDSHADYYPA